MSCKIVRERFLSLKRGLLKISGLGMSLFALFSPTSAKSQKAPSDSTPSTLSRKSSGTLAFPSNEIEGEFSGPILAASRPTGRKRSVVLAQAPKAGEVPTLAADLNTAMMGPDMVKAMDDQYAIRLRDYSLNNGFYATSQFSRHQGPSGKTPQDEANTRREMARSIQRYMLVRGIPKFLASKPETKGLAKTYNNVVVMTRVQGKTESRWEYKTGINPFQLRFFGNISKDGWFFETSTFYNKGGRYKLNDVYLTANKTYFSGKYSTGCNYEVFTEHLIPNVSRNFNRNLNTSLNSRMPLGALGVGAASVTTLAMNYSF